MKAKTSAAVALGKRGGIAKWKKTTKAQRIAHAKKMAAARWPKKLAAKQ